YAFLGEAYFNQGDYSEAVNAFRRALAGDLSLSERNKANNYLARALEKLGSKDEAIAAARQAVTSKDNDPYTLNNLGNQYLYAGQYAKALEIYNQALVIDHAFIDAQINIGNCYLMLNDLDKALSAYKKALKINPQWAMAYYHIGVVYINTPGNWQKGIDNFAKAVELKPGLLDIIGQKLPRVKPYVEEVLKAKTKAASSALGKNDDYHVGIQIKEVRKELGISQVQLSKWSGVPQGQLSRFENGPETPRMATLRKIEQALRRSLHTSHLSGYAGSLIKAERERQSMAQVESLPKSNPGGLIWVDFIGKVGSSSIHLMPGVLDAVRLGVTRDTIVRCEQREARLLSPTGWEVELDKTKYPNKDDILSRISEREIREAVDKLPFYYQIDHVPEFNLGPTMSAETQSLLVKRLLAVCNIPLKDVISVQVNVGIESQQVSEVYLTKFLADAHFLMLSVVIAFVTDKRIRNKKTWVVVTDRGEKYSASIDGVPYIRIEYAFADIYHIRKTARIIQYLHKSLLECHRLSRGRVSLTGKEKTLAGVWNDGRGKELRAVAKRIIIDNKNDLNFFDAGTYKCLIDWRRKNRDSVDYIRILLRETAKECERIIHKASSSLHPEAVHPAGILKEKIPLVFAGSIDAAAIEEEVKRVRLCPYSLYEQEIARIWGHLEFHEFKAGRDSEKRQKSKVKRESIREIQGRLARLRKSIYETIARQMKVNQFMRWWEEVLASCGGNYNAAIEILRSHMAAVDAGGSYAKDFLNEMAWKMMVKHETGDNIEELGKENKEAEKISQDVIFSFYQQDNLILQRVPIYLTEDSFITFDVLNSGFYRVGPLFIVDNEIKKSFLSVFPKKHIDKVIFMRKMFEYLPSMAYLFHNITAVAAMLYMRQKIKNSCFLDCGSGNGILMAVALSLGAVKAIGVENIPFAGKETDDTMGINQYGPGKHELVNCDLRKKASVLKALKKYRDRIVCGIVSIGNHFPGDEEAMAASYAILSELCRFMISSGHIGLNLNLWTNNYASYRAVDGTHMAESDTVAIEGYFAKKRFSSFEIVRTDFSDKSVVGKYHMPTFHKAVIGRRMPRFGSSSAVKSNPRGLIWSGFIGYLSSAADDLRGSLPRGYGVSSSAAPSFLDEASGIVWSLSGGDISSSALNTPKQTPGVCFDTGGVNLNEVALAAIAPFATAIAHVLHYVSGNEVTINAARAGEGLTLLISRAFRKMFRKMNVGGVIEIAEKERPYIPELLRKGTTFGDGDVEIGIGLDVLENSRAIYSFPAKGPCLSVLLLGLKRALWGWVDNIYFQKMVIRGKKKVAISLDDDCHTQVGLWEEACDKGREDIKVGILYPRERHEKIVKELIEAGISFDTKDFSIMRQALMKTGIYENGNLILYEHGELDAFNRLCRGELDVLIGIGRPTEAEVMLHGARQRDFQFLGRFVSYDNLTDGKCTPAALINPQNFSQREIGLLRRNNIVSPDAALYLRDGQVRWNKIWTEKDGSPDVWIISAYINTCTWDNKLKGVSFIPRGNKFDVRVLCLGPAIEDEYTEEALCRKIQQGFIRGVDPYIYELEKVNRLKPHSSYVFQLIFKSKLDSFEKKSSETNDLTRKTALLAAEADCRLHFGLFDQAEGAVIKALTYITGPELEQLRDKYHALHAYISAHKELTQEKGLAAIGKANGHLISCVMFWSNYIKGKSAKNIMFLQKDQGLLIKLKRLLSLDVITGKRLSQIISELDQIRWPFVKEYMLFGSAQRLLRTLRRSLADTYRLEGRRYVLDLLRIFPLAEDENQGVIYPDIEPLSHNLVVAQEHYKIAKMLLPMREQSGEAGRLEIELIDLHIQETQLLLDIFTKIQERRDPTQEEWHGYGRIYLALAETRRKKGENEQAVTNFEIGLECFWSQIADAIKGLAPLTVILKIARMYEDVSRYETANLWYQRLLEPESFRDIVHPKSEIDRDPQGLLKCMQYRGAFPEVMRRYIRSFLLTVNVEERVIDSFLRREVDKWIKQDRLSFKNGTAWFKINGFNLVLLNILISKDLFASPDASSPIDNRMKSNPRGLIWSGFIGYLSPAADDLRGSLPRGYGVSSSAAPSSLKEKVAARLDRLMNMRGIKNKVLVAAAASSISDATGQKILEFLMKETIRMLDAGIVPVVRLSTIAGAVSVDASLVRVILNRIKTRQNIWFINGDGVILKEFLRRTVVHFNDMAVKLRRQKEKESVSTRVAVLNKMILMHNALAQANGEWWRVSRDYFALGKMYEEAGDLNQALDAVYRSAKMNEDSAAKVTPGLARDDSLIWAIRRYKTVWNIYGKLGARDRQKRMMVKIKQVCLLISDFNRRIFTLLELRENLRGEGRFKESAEINLVIANVNQLNGAISEALESVKFLLYDLRDEISTCFVSQTVHEDNALAIAETLREEKPFVLQLVAWSIRKLAVLESSIPEVDENFVVKTAVCYSVISNIYFVLGLVSEAARAKQNQAWVGQDIGQDVYTAKCLRRVGKLWFVAGEFEKSVIAAKEAATVYTALAKGDERVRCEETAALSLYAFGKVSDALAVVREIVRFIGANRFNQAWMLTCLQQLFRDQTFRAILGQGIDVDELGNEDLDINVVQLRVDMQRGMIVDVARSFINQLYKGAGAGSGIRASSAVGTAIPKDHLEYNARELVFASNRARANGSFSESTGHLKGAVLAHQALGMDRELALDYLHIGENYKALRMFEDAARYFIASAETNVAAIDRACHGGVKDWYRMMALEVYKQAWLMYKELGFYYGQEQAEKQIIALSQEFLLLTGNVSELLIELVWFFHTAKRFKIAVQINLVISQLNENKGDFS
ncbi:MAG: tetratricopeptide repeat protein, partial [Candidatus Omnitrophota bacterium]